MGVAAGSPQRGEVFLVLLGHTKGSEIKKTRPCVILSPDELNSQLTTFIVAPMTTGGQAHPFRIPCRFQRKSGFVVLDQVRTVDRHRLVRRLGKASNRTLKKALGTLQEMFAE